MTRLALPGKWGALVASGLTSLRASSASNCETMPGKTNEPVISERNICRREQEQPEWFIINSIHEQKFIAGEQHLAKRGERHARLLLERRSRFLQVALGGVQEILAIFELGARRVTSISQLI